MCAILYAIDKTTGLQIMIYIVPISTILTRCANRSKIFFQNFLRRDIFSRIFNNMFVRTMKTMNAHFSLFSLFSVYCSKALAQYSTAAVKKEERIDMQLAFERQRHARESLRKIKIRSPFYRYARLPREAYSPLFFRLLLVWTFRQTVWNVNAADSPDASHVHGTARTTLRVSRAKRTRVAKERALACNACRFICTDIDFTNPPFHEFIFCSFFQNRLFVFVTFIINYDVIHIWHMLPIKLQI